MDEQLDNDLNNRIREVFDNFEDQSYPSADEGWLLLREKFPETEKKRPVAWLWWASAAAAILLFIGIGVWINDKKQQSETLAVKPVKQQEQTTITDNGKLLAKKQTPVIKTNPVTAAAVPIIDTATTKYAAKAQSGKLSQSASSSIAGNNAIAVQQPANNALTAAKKADSVKTIIAKTNTQQIAVIAPVTTGSNTKAPAASQNAKPATGVQPAVIAKTNTQQLAVTPTATTGTNTLTPASKNTTVTPGSSAVNQQPVKGPRQTPPANSMAALFASESANSKKPNVQYTDDKKVRFGVYAATFFNYAKGSSNQVNAGAGFTSEIKLSNNIKLSTGVALAQNTLSYNGAPPSPGPHVASDALARGLSASYTNNKENLFALNADQIYPVLKNYNASLIGLDVPLNIKYEFNPQKSDTYISAGLSSGTFINEAYTKVYGLASASGEVNNTTTDDVSRKSFNGFYFARTLNVSFGVGYPIGKGNKLIIEPFLKYPLDGLGAQQLRFGAGGLNLKFNFTNKK